MTMKTAFASMALGAALLGWQGAQQTAHACGHGCIVYRPSLYVLHNEASQPVPYPIHSKAKLHGPTPYPHIGMGA